VTLTFKNGKQRPQHCPNKGKVKAADAIKGFVMRETKGMAKTEVVQQLLMQELAKE
jgi:Asp-tRNA(Asn)/Glu-tRNA(Gln) amidotransferase B subunit